MLQFGKVAFTITKIEKNIFPIAPFQKHPIIVGRQFKAFDLTEQRGSL